MRRQNEDALNVCARTECQTIGEIMGVELESNSFGRSQIGEIVTEEEAELGFGATVKMMGRLKRPVSQILFQPLCVFHKLLFNSLYFGILKKNQHKYVFVYISRNIYCRFINALFLYASSQLRSATYFQWYKQHLHYFGF